MDCAALAETMLSLEQNGHSIERVIIEKPPRFSRHRMVQESIIRDFISHGFDLISALDGLDLLSGNPTRKFIRQMLGAIAENEKDMIVFELRAARDPKRAREGKCCIVCLNVRQASARCRPLGFQAVGHKTGPSSATGNHGKRGFEAEMHTGKAIWAACPLSYTNSLASFTMAGIYPVK